MKNKRNVVYFCTESGYSGYLVGTELVKEDIYIFKYPDGEISKTNNKSDIEDDCELIKVIKKGSKILSQSDENPINDNQINFDSLDFFWDESGMFIGERYEVVKRNIYVIDDGDTEFLTRDKIVEILREETGEFLISTDELNDYLIARRGDVLITGVIVE